MATQMSSLAPNKTSTQRITTHQHRCRHQHSSILHLKVIPQLAQRLSNSRRRAVPGVAIVQASRPALRHPPPHTTNLSQPRLLARQRKQMPLRRPSSSRCDRLRLSQVMNTVRSLSSHRHALRKRLRRKVNSSRPNLGRKSRRQHQSPRRRLHHSRKRRPT